MEKKMKDIKDKKTTELFRTGTALRQERFIEVKNYVKQLEIAKNTAES
jgi:hypothetical protein